MEEHERKADRPNVKVVYISSSHILFARTHLWSRTEEKFAKYSLDLCSERKNMI